MRHWISSPLLKWGLLTGVILASLSYAIHRAWRLSVLPGVCNTAARLESWEELETNAREWTTLKPNHSMAWFWLGLSQRGQGQYNEAFDSFEHVPLRGARGIDAAVARLELQFHLFHEPIEALKIAEEIERLEPDNIDALRHQIYFYAMTMRRPQMVAKIRQVTHQGGDIPEHYLYLLNLEDLWFSDGPDVTAKWEEHDPQSALLHVSHVVQEAKVARAAWRTSPGRLTEEAYQRWIQVCERLPDKLSEYSQVLEFRLDNAQAAGEVAQVGALLARVDDQDTDDPTFWRYRAWYAFRVGNLLEAESSYHEVIRLNPMSIKARHEFAQFLRSQGKTKEASQQQTLADRGTTLVAQVQKLTHLRDATPQLLSQIAQFASDCGDWETSNGIYKHQDPNMRSPH